MFAATGLLLLLTGCSDGSDRVAREDTARTPVSMSRGELRAPAEDAQVPGDVRIVTVGDGFDLALIGDSISSGLSRTTLAMMRRETDSATVGGSGFGADLEKLVKGKVQQAVATRVSVPLSAVREVRYEQGALIFDWNGKPPALFAQTKINGKSFLESFTPDDARRFADAVRLRKGRRGDF